MNERDKRVLAKLLDHTTRAVSYASACKTYEAFLASDMATDACVFNIMQIGELSKNELSEEARDAMSSIPWKSIFGMRNRIVHGYSSVDMKVVWDTVTENLPQFADEIRHCLEIDE